jgi:predicted CoA-binding protein
MEAPSTLEEARRFLGARRIALVGLSRNPKDFSRGVLRALAERGYDVVGVNPEPPPGDGLRWFTRVQDVTPPPEAALLLTPPGQTERVLRDCDAAGVRRVWLHRGAGAGAESPQALAFCREHGIEAVHGLCPFMALPGAGLGHRVHAFVRLRKARPS